MPKQNIESSEDLDSLVDGPTPEKILKATVKRVVASGLDRATIIALYGKRAGRFIPRGHA
jgi:hypothetical protein